MLFFIGFFIVRRKRLVVRHFELVVTIFGILEMESNPAYPYLESINPRYPSKRMRVSSEVHVNYQRKRVKISITSVCNFEIVRKCQKICFSPKSCSESKKFHKIVKVAQKLSSRVYLVLLN